RQGDTRRRRADRDVGLVVAVGGGEQALADVGLALVVLLDDDDLLARDGHRPAGGVVEAHHEAGLRLLAVRLERTGLAVDVGDADLALALRERERRRERGERGDREQRSAAAVEHGVGDEGHGGTPGLVWRPARRRAIGAKSRGSDDVRWAERRESLAAAAHLSAASLTIVPVEQNLAATVTPAQRLHHQQGHIVHKVPRKTP